MDNHSMTDSLEIVIRKHALKNAFDYAKADVKSVTGKVIAEHPDSKKDMKRTMELVSKEVALVNEMGKDEVKKELADYAFVARKEEKKENWNLPGVEEGTVVTRFLPEPNGFLHLGHAKAAFLSEELAKQYSGKMLLRFDDTNPEKEKQEFVDAIKEDADWLGLKFEGKETYTSDLMPEFYGFAERMISQGDAYACFCIQEVMKKNRELKKPCACREKRPAENLDGWRQMTTSLKEGEAVLRLKGNLESDNTVMRDPTLFRILETPHYRQGARYRVWPTYDFEVSISDSLNGVTHALRSKEYELRDDLYYFILDKLGLRKPVVYDFSRLNIRGNALSKRLLKPFVEEKKVWGWDDPRLLTIRGMRRRGLLPQSIHDFVLGFGLSKVESSPSIEKLFKENQKLLEPVAEHYFFVSKPVKLLVKNSKETFAKIPKHPAVLEKGHRLLHAQKDFFVSNADAAGMEEGEVFRLKELYNVKLLEKTPNGLVGEYAGKELKENTKKLQWVPALHAVQAELISVGDLLIDDKFNPKSIGVESGYCEEDCKKLHDGAIVQLERIGFARLDDKKKMVFILCK